MYKGNKFKEADDYMDAFQSYMEHGGKYRLQLRGNKKQSGILEFYSTNCVLSKDSDDTQLYFELSPGAVAFDISNTKKIIPLSGDGFIIYFLDGSTLDIVKK